MANEKDNVNKTSFQKASEPTITEVKKPVAKVTATKATATKNTEKAEAKTEAKKTTKPVTKTELKSSDSEVKEVKKEVKATAKADEVKSAETAVKAEVKKDKKTEDTQPEAKGETLLEVKNLCQYFPVERNFFGKPIKFLKAVDGVSFSLQKGKTLGIVGESGCGKTTMGRTILRLYDVTSGEVWFKGQKVTDLKNKDFDKLRPNMQMIFQDPYASLSPRLTVGEIIGEAALQHGIVSKADYHDYVLSVMKMCGLQPHYFERYPHEFSGGQRQRICIARALALKPELVICDEPVSALDVSIQAQIINMLIELRKTLGLTYVFISHDLSVVKHISDQVGVMYLGTMVEYGSKNDIFEHTLHPYTKALFSAVPVPNPHVKMNRIILKGDIPSPVNPPKGCKFHTRCEKCMEICTRISPEYREIEAGHFCACHLYNTPELEKALEEKYVEEQRLAAEKEANKNAVEKFADSFKHKVDDCKKKVISAFKKKPEEETKDDTTNNVDIK
jgi:peptide/nickel transport system ATP-binding protein